MVSVCAAAGGGGGGDMGAPPPPRSHVPTLRQADAADSLSGPPGESSSGSDDAPPLLRPGLVSSAPQLLGQLPGSLPQQLAREAHPSAAKVGLKQRAGLIPLASCGWHAQSGCCSKTSGKTRPAASTRILTVSAAPLPVVDATGDPTCTGVDLPVAAAPHAAAAAADLDMCVTTAAAAAAPAAAAPAAAPPAPAFTAAVPVVPAPAAGPAVGFAPADANAAAAPVAVAAAPVSCSAVMSLRPVALAQSPLAGRNNATSGAPLLVSSLCILSSGQGAQPTCVAHAGAPQVYLLLHVRHGRRGADPHFEQLRNLCPGRWLEILTTHWSKGYFHTLKMRVNSATW
eukprot:363159-Chlamydomonas_euryale.AAC.4